MSVSREKLYEEVWAEPMTTVAKRYDVSSNFLARVCERLNVPRPPRGYWAQIKIGRKLKKPALAELNAGDEIEWVRNGTARVYLPSATTGVDAPKQSRSRPKHTRHPLVLGAREHFEAARVSREGYLKPYKRNIVDMFVSKDVLDRALNVANDLFRSLESRGYAVFMAPAGASYSRGDLKPWDEGQSRTYYWDGWAGPARITHLRIKDVAIGLTLFEISAEFETRWDETLKRHVRKGPPRHQKPGEPIDWRIHNDWLPSGRLGVHAYAARSQIKWERYWRESKPGELRRMLDAIGKELEVAVPVIEKLIVQKEREDEEQRRKWDEQKRAWEIEEAERRRAEREEERKTEIVETIDAWRLARDVRAYVKEVRDLVQGAGLEIIDGAGADDELKWALQYADRIDPLSAWREDIARESAQKRRAPCPDCGEIHKEERPGEAEPPSRSEEASHDPQPR